MRRSSLLQFALAVVILFSFVTVARADVTLPENTVVIEEQAFINDTSLSGALVIPDGVTTIGAEAFAGCTGLTNVVVPDSVTAIEAGAFSGCTGLTGTLELSADCAVAEDAFEGCDRLMIIYAVPATPAEYFTYTIENDEVTITGFDESCGVTEVVVPEKIDGYLVKNVGDQAFQFQEELNSIVIPDGVVSIGETAFYYCTALERVELPQSLQRIGMGVFASCHSLEVVIIPDDVQVIPECAFMGCSKLMSVELPSQLTQIGENAFTDCSSLENVEFPAKLKTIGYEAFRDCDGLLTVLLPEGVTSIGANAFNCCDALQRVVIPGTVTTWGEAAFAGNENLSELVLSEGLTVIGPACFASCTALTQLSIPDSVTSIESMAFFNCSSLTGDLRLCEDIDLAEDAFEDCPKLSIVFVKPATPVEYFNYTINVYDNEVTITGFDESCGVTEVVVPETIEGYPVTRIGASAFNTNLSLVSITFPDTLQSIGDEAFYCCTALQSLTLPEGATEIGVNSFSYCQSLHSVTIPGSVEIISQVAFAGDTSLKTLNLSEGLKVIDASAFAYCTALETLTLPESVTSIETAAFMGCENLQGELKIRDTVYVDNTAFTDCPNLTITFISSATPVECFTYSISNNEVTITGFDDSCGVAYVVVPETIEGYPVTKIGAESFYNCSDLRNVILPEGIESIGNFAFAQCINLTNISLPDSLVSIGDNCFSYCSLIEINLPRYLSSIGQCILGDCQKLTSITISTENKYYKVENNALISCDGVLLAYPVGKTDSQYCIPNGVLSIGTAAFYNSKYLVDIVIPGSVSRIEEEAFRQCSLLETVDYTDGITYIGDRAFYHCTRLTTCIIPDSIQYIGSGAFESCKMLTGHIVIDSDVNIAYDAFYSTGIRIDIKATVSCYTYTIEDNAITITKFAGGRSTIVEIPSVISGIPVVAIGNDVFKQNSYIRTVTIPESILTIGDNVFSGCSSLSSICLPDGLIRIGASAFSGCSKLESITLPDSVEIIGEYAFNWCEGLKHVTLSKSLDALPNALFQSCKKLESIVIPNGVYEIGHSCFNICDSLEKIELPNTVTTIGDMAFAQCDKLVSVNIPVSVNSIEGNPFYGSCALTEIAVADDNPTYSSYNEALIDNAGLLISCAYSSIPEEYIIPSHVTSIGGFAFSGCSRLSSVTIPDGVTRISGSAFSGCSRLSSITIPDSITNIGSSAFSGCSSLTSLIIPGDVTIIEQYSFENCNNLVSIILPNSVKTIDMGAFSNCNSLASIDLPDSLTRIGDHAFSNCSNLTSITIPNGVTNIGGYAFYSCYSLTSIAIPANTKSIGMYARPTFKYCSDTLVIYGEPDSYAESYARSYGINFSVEPMPEPDYGEKNVDLAVYVYSPDGAPIADATVYALHHETQVAIAQQITGSDGCARFTNLQHRPYLFRCVAGSFHYEDKYLYLGDSVSKLDFYGAATEYDYLRPAAYSYVAAQSGAEIEIPILSSDAWKAACSADWILLENATGAANAPLTVQVLANEGGYSSGMITVTSGALQCTLYINQPGTLGTRLATPVITYPAADLDTVPYADLTIRWDAVEGAERYVVSLRDLDTDTLLMHHFEASSSTETTIPTTSFDDGHSYRVAVGAVPGGMASSDAAVGWCERTFTVSEFINTEPVVFTGKVYELYNAALAAEIKALSRSGFDSPLIAQAREEAADGIDFRLSSDVQVSVYHLNSTSAEWEFMYNVYTDEYGVYTISKDLIDGEVYSFVFFCTDTSFIMGDIYSTRYTAHPGVNEIIDIYHYKTDLAEQIEAFLNLQSFDLSGASRELFAEYFAYTDKHNSFTAANKRNEGTVENIDFSWVGEEISTGTIFGNAKSYYVLKAYPYGDDAGSSSATETINYVPYKFAARFTGFMKLHGGQTADSMEAYKFRVRGDDGVRIFLDLPHYSGLVPSECWMNRGVFENVAEFDLTELPLLNGTTLSVNIEYYNKSAGGKANLIFEYSIDDGNEWNIVPASWLYHMPDERTVWVTNRKEQLGVDYARQLAESDATLSNYTSQMIADMLCSLAGKSIDSGIDAFNTNSVVFDEIQISETDMIARFWMQNLGKKTSKAVYTAVFGTYCGLNSEEEIWEKIAEEIKDEFGLEFETVYDVAGSAIDGIGSMIKLNEKLRDNVHSNATITTLQSSILNNIEEYTIGAYKDLDCANETVASGYSQIIDLAGTARDTIGNSVAKLDPGLELVWTTAKSGMNLLDRLWGIKDANDHRALLLLTFLESGEIPGLFDACFQMAYFDYGESVWNFVYNSSGPVKIETRDQLETRLNIMNNGQVNSLIATMQDVNLTELLYKDLLITTLDVTVDYYKALLGGDI